MSEAKKRPWAIIGMFAIGVLPIFLAVIMYLTGWGIPEGRTNNGHLINPPLDIKNLNATSKVENLNTWWILTVTNDDCNKVCQKQVYHVRQVNIALGKNQERVQHGIISTNLLNEKQKDFFKDYPNLKVFLTTEADLRVWLGALNKQLAADATKESIILVVDPLGNAMLYYTPDQDPRDILDDLNKLLKYSTIG